MPLVKTAPPATPAVPVTASETHKDLEWAGIPVDIYNHFNVELGKADEKETKKLKDIYEWAKSRCEEPTLGNVMSRVASLENQLGVPDIGTRRYDKMWNWVRLSRQMEDLDKRREVLRKRWA